MTVSAEIEGEIRRKYFAEHWKRGTIATQLGVHMDVVERVIGPLGPKPGTPRPQSTLLDLYKPFVDDTLAQYPKLVATRLYDMIRERGYAGSLRTLRRYVRTARPRPRKAFLALETLPGEVAEIDWGHVGELRVPGGHRPLWIFVMVLRHSRAAFVELVLSLDGASLRRSLIRAAHFFKGNARAWLFDNAKTVVVARRGRLVRFQSGLVDLAGQMHVELRVCDPRAPHQKGSVERFIRYVKGRFFAARHIRDVAHGNQQLLEFLAEIAHERSHPRLAGQTVADVFEDEQQRLLPLPDVMPPIESVTPVNVDVQGFVNLDTNRYSVPSRHAPGTLSMVSTDAMLSFFDGDDEVASHVRCWGRKQTLEKAEHRTELIAERQAARGVKGRDRLRVEVPDIDVLLERWMDREYNMGSMVTRTIKLLDAYGGRVLCAAVDEMIASELVDMGALAVLCERHRKRDGGDVMPVIELAPHVQECDVVPHDLGGYDE